ncbi:MAG: type III-A CRISPR-associated RAMP protein Csm5 [Anaerolineae bacterium]|nr:type III-A CRISPR-associated RAMP protein Csm5 [Anaerolineae bacterium]
MPFDYTTYAVTVTPLTPLHIGSGMRLLKDYDYAVHNNRTWRINEDALLEAQWADNPALADTLARTPPVQLLQPQDYRLDSTFFRYTLAGQPRAKEQGAQLQELLKTVHDEPYLPGSSLKGAIRTALAWQGWQEQGRRPSMRDLERNSRFAGRQIEKELLGPDPNHDLLRALQVSDSRPAGKDRLILVNVQVVTRRGLQAPIELEAIRPDTPFELTIKVDNRLLGTWAEQHRLRLGGNTAWLTQLPEVIQQHTQQRLQDEATWYQERTGAEATVKFFQQLLNARLPQGSCLLQIGWGTGWSDKTYGSHLQNDQRFIDALVRDYRLSMGNRHNPGDPFPKSRRSVVQTFRDKRGKIRQKATVPLGWVLMEMKEQPQ